MKNIAILGSSRSGKSTLAKMISKKYPNYHVMISAGLFKRSYLIILIAKVALE